MLDDDDLDFAILVWPEGGWFVALVGIIVIVVMAFVVASNKKECESKKCERGAPVLMHNECLCAEKPGE